MTTKLNIDELERLAREATPGPWAHDSVKSEGAYGDGPDAREGFDEYVIYDLNNGHVLFDSLGRESSAVEVQEEYDDHEGNFEAWDELARRDARFIAAFNPATALELIENLHATELRANANAKMLSGANSIASELAGEVNRLKAQNAVLLSALKPFAAIDLAESGTQSTFAFDVLLARAAIASTEENNL
jgi:hypothetical protein